MEARGWNRTIREKVLLTPAFPLGYRALTVHTPPIYTLGVGVYASWLKVTVLGAVSSRPAKYLRDGLLPRREPRFQSLSPSTGRRRLIRLVQSRYDSCP